MIRLTVIAVAASLAFAPAAALACGAHASHATDLSAAKKKVKKKAVKVAAKKKEKVEYMRAVPAK
jgi:lactam utilization protein B